MLSTIAFYILSQSLFHFDNVSFLAQVLNQLFLPNESFNQSSILPHNGFTNLFSTVQETNRFMEVEWLKK